MEGKGGFLAVLVVAALAAPTGVGIACFTSCKYERYLPGVSRRVGGEFVSLAILANRVLRLATVGKLVPLNTRSGRTQTIPKTRLS